MYFFLIDFRDIIDFFQLKRQQLGFLCYLEGLCMIFICTYTCFVLNSKTVTCLAYSTNGNVLLSGSEDGMIRVWDPKTHNMVRVFRHAKGLVLII